MKRIILFVLTVVLLNGGLSSSGFGQGFTGETVGTGHFPAPASPPSYPSDFRSDGMPSRSGLTQPPGNNQDFQGMVGGTSAIGASISPGNGEMGMDGMRQPRDREQPTRAPSPMPEQMPEQMQNPGQTSTTITTPTPDSDLELRGVLNTDHPLLNVMRMERPMDSAIEGKPLYLHELLKGVYSPKVKQHLVREYWALTEKYLIYKYRVMQYALLTNQLYTPFQDNTLVVSQLDSAIQMVAHQQKAAELEFIQYQYCFSELVRQYSGYVCSTEQNPSGLLIPADVPIATPYNTRSDRMNLVSTRAKLLDKTIPLQFEVVQNRQEAFQASEGYLRSVVSGGESPVASLALCIDEQIALLRAITEYNNQIVDYVTETVGGDVTGKRYLSTILYLQNPPTAQPSHTMSVSEGVSPRTFYEGSTEDFPITQTGYVQ